MEHSHLFEIYFPIIQDEVYEGDYDDKKTIIKELNNIVSKRLITLSEYIVKYLVSLTIEPYNSDLKLEDFGEDLYYQSNSHLEEDNLKFTFEIETNYKLYKPNFKIDKEGPGKDYYYETHMPFNLCDFFKDYVFELLILSQIARPGSLKLRIGTIFHNNNIHLSRIPKILDIRQYLIFRENNSYPIIKYLNFEKFYNWIIKNDLLFPLDCKNSFQKALNNLSYINAENSLISVFIYQMRTLEILYVVYDNKSKTKNLDENIQSFLGIIEKFKKQIKDMYEIRSKFLHGNSELYPYHKSNINPFKKDHEFSNKIPEAFQLSLLLIIATLQEMYQKNIVDLKPFLDSNSIQK